MGRGVAAALPELEEEETGLTVDRTVSSSQEESQRIKDVLALHGEYLDENIQVAGAVHGYLDLRRSKREFPFNFIYSGVFYFYCLDSAGSQELNQREGRWMNVQS